MSIGVISLIVLAVINLVGLAYGYGKLNQKVTGICTSVDNTLKKMEANTDRILNAQKDIQDTRRDVIDIRRDVSSLQNAAVGR